jgi:hypothetical protein
MTDARKAWQEPMVWLMAGIPLATVVAGLYTLYIAMASGPLDSVPASVQRVAQTQTLSSASDATASQRHYSGYLIIDRQTQPWQLTLKTMPETLAQQPTEVLFVHANRAELDVRIRLASGSAKLPAALNFTPQQIVVTDAAGTWRLVGQYGSSATIALSPALQEP